MIFSHCPNTAREPEALKHRARVPARATTQVEPAARQPPRKAIIAALADDAACPAKYEKWKSEIHKDENHFAPRFALAGELLLTITSKVTKSASY